MHNKLAVPIELPTSEKYIFAFHLANLTYDIEHARKMFGSSSYHDFVDGLGDADFWAFTYPCGMKLLYEFIHPLVPTADGIANVYGDLPEFAHAERHIPFPKNSIHQSSPENNKREIEHFKTVEPWPAEISSLFSYQVWRQGDDGNEMPVGEPTSQRDAECWVRELDSHGHKQTYWYIELGPSDSSQ